MTIFVSPPPTVVPPSLPSLPSDPLVGVVTSGVSPSIPSKPSNASWIDRPEPAGANTPSSEDSSEALIEPTVEEEKLPAPSVPLGALNKVCSSTPLSVSVATSSFLLLSGSISRGAKPLFAAAFPPCPFTKLKLSPFTIELGSTALKTASVREDCKEAYAILPEPNKLSVTPSRSSAEY